VGVLGGAPAVYLMRALTGTQGNGPVKVAHAYNDKSKLDALLGPSFFDEIQGKTVIDFGSGLGHQSVEMAKRGAGHVVGVEIREDFLEKARAHAAAAGVSDKCTFLTTLDRPADVVVSLDSFEHFSDPEAILTLMADYLRPGGRLIASFGPTWYHPYGGHMFAIFPWAHLIFTEAALLEWRRTFRPNQTATRITECGLNKMTIRRFERIVAGSPFRVVHLEAVPMRQLAWLANPLTREFFTSVIRCTLEKAPSSQPAIA
jgi:SAM-dependent methyltransferase